MKHEQTQLSDEQLLTLLERASAGGSFVDACRELGVDRDAQAGKELLLFWNDIKEFSQLHVGAVPDESFALQLIEALPLPYQATRALRPLVKASPFGWLIFLDWRVVMPFGFVALLLVVGLSRNLGVLPSVVPTPPLAMNDAANIQPMAVAERSDTPSINSEMPMSKMNISATAPQSGTFAMMRTNSSTESMMKPTGDLAMLVANESAVDLALVADAGTDASIVSADVKALTALSQTYDPATF